MEFDCHIGKCTGSSHPILKYAQDSVPKFSYSHSHIPVSKIEKTKDVSHQQIAASNDLCDQHFKPRNKIQQHNNNNDRGLERMRAGPSVKYRPSFH